MTSSCSAMRSFRHVARLATARSARHRGSGPSLAGALPWGLFPLMAFRGPSVRPPLPPAAGPSARPSPRASLPWRALSRTARGGALLSVARPADRPSPRWALPPRLLGCGRRPSRLLPWGPLPLGLRSPVALVCQAGLRLRRRGEPAPLGTVRATPVLRAVVGERGLPPREVRPDAAGWTCCRRPLEAPSPRGAAGEGGSDGRVLWAWGCLAQKRPLLDSNRGPPLPKSGALTVKTIR